MDQVAQQELLDTHRQTLVHLLKNAAAYGGETFAPPQVAAGIAQARAEIARLKPALRAAGAPVDDLLIDTPTEQPDMPAAPLRGQISIRIGDNSSVGGGVVANTGTMTTTFAAPTPRSPLDAAIAAVQTAQTAANARGESDLAADLHPVLLALEAGRTAQTEHKTERATRKLAEAHATLQSLATSNPHVAEAAGLVAALQVRS